MTNYINDPKGISSKYERFSKEWFKKRNQAHFFLKSFFKDTTYPYKIDFFISKLMFLLIKKLKFLKILFILIFQLIYFTLNSMLYIRCIL